MWASLDGSRQVEEQLEEGKPATALSALDHYTNRTATPQFEEMTLLHFVQHYSIPKSVGEEPEVRKKMVVVRVRPQYEQYCQQKLMLHRPFREYRQLKAGCDTFAEAFAGYLQSGSIPPSLEDDLYLLQQQQQQQQDPGESDSGSEEYLYTSIEIQWNKTWKCHHMRLFHVALGRQMVGTWKALLDKQSWDPSGF